jgi:hypothetical protein
MMAILLRDNVVTTRKIHACIGCGMRYPIGTRMLYQSGVSYGDFWTAYYCPTCQGLHYDWFYDFDEIECGLMLTEWTDAWLAERMRDGA